MMKKLKTFLLLSMMVVLVMGMTVSAAGSGKLALTADKTELKPGDTVTVTLNVADNPGIVMLNTEIGFDANTFVLMDKDPRPAEDGEDEDELAETLQKFFIPDQASQKLSQDTGEGDNVSFYLGSDTRSSNYTKTGDVATFVLKVKDSAVNGSVELSFNVLECRDFNGDIVEFSGSPVSLTITGGVCEHKLTKVDAVPASCDKAGNKEYYKCSECGKLFTDAEGKNETTTDAVTIAVPGHKMTKTAAVPATCEKDGNIEYYTCSECKNIYKDAEGKTKITSADTVVKATGHKLTKVAAVAASCDKAGNKEYYKCTECGKLFEDAAGKTVTTLAKVTIAATGHKLTKVAAVSATCEKAGNKEYYKCSECGKLFEDADGKTETTLDKVTIAATGHSWDEGKITTEPGCETKGVKTYTCTKCKTTKTEEVEATGHSWDEGVVTKKATATEDGIITYTCTKDKDHTKTEAFKEKIQNPEVKSVTSFSDNTATKKLTDALVAKKEYLEKDIAYYDITMMVSEDNGKTYVPVTEETMPKEGVKVRIPYPSGTNPVDYDFVVLHLLSNGTVETLQPEEASEYLIVTAKSLSPFAVGYKEGEEDDSDDDEPAPVASSTSTGTTNDGAIRSPKTGDMTSVAMWILIACTGATIMFGTAYGRKNKR
ncbi:MAG: hypothetical protein IJ794_12090 [Lachnospiraceae bacterium]|nr:hypothetical protein [Lachnospiraceae bacterium]MBR1853860.1 hypothetical protein [Lachnospiraceae bacterium]